MSSVTVPNAKNPIALSGIEFVEYSGPDPDMLRRIFREFGFSRLLQHTAKAMDYYRQGDIHFIINNEKGSFAESFQKAHGPCISAMGWRVADPELAFKTAVSRGARPAIGRDYPLPAILGIGDSLIYFVREGQKSDDFYRSIGFTPGETTDVVPDKGFIQIDHLTNNVAQGTMRQWADFYEKIFGFVEVRYFDIRGAKTGLTSFALRSPCGSFCIPINEATEKKSQINEYLDEYHGPGIQHLAFLTKDIVKSLEAMQGTGIATLSIDDEYYASVFDRVPNVSENHDTLRRLNILVDGDDDGYLLQIFTKNLIGPIFIEIIQRKNHLSFGEGNFGALFRSIERDQEERGYL